MEALDEAFAALWVLAGLAGVGSFASSLGDISWYRLGLVVTSSMLRKKRSFCFRKEGVGRGLIGEDSVVTMSSSANGRTKSGPALLRGSFGITGSN